MIPATVLQIGGALPLVAVVLLLLAVVMVYQMVEIVNAYEKRADRKSVV